MKGRLWVMVGVLSISVPSWAQGVARSASTSDQVTVGGALVIGGFGRFGLVEDAMPAPMKPSFGAAAQAEVPLAEWFALGGSLELSSWGFRGSEGRNALVDLMVRPRVRYVYDDRLEFGLVALLGGFISAIGEKQFFEKDTRPGWSFGGRPQVRVHTGGPLTVSAEAGWHRRAARHEVVGFDFDGFSNEVVAQVAVLGRL